MSGEKKRSRWRRALPFREESRRINSKSSTTTTKTQEEKHTENIQRKWYKKPNDNADQTNDVAVDDDDDDDNDERIRLSLLLPNETISEKIDRVIRKIDAWTNETSTTRTRTTTRTTNNNTTIKQQTSFNQTNPPVFNYDKIYRRQYPSSQPKPAYTSLINSFRRRCSSSTYSDQSMNKIHQISSHRPYSMIFIDEPLPMTNLHDHQSFYEKPTRSMRTFQRQSSLEPNLYQYQRQSNYPTTIHPTSRSSMYGSDFFFPSTCEQEQHDYDNLTFTENSSRNNYEPFPTILLDCQRCSRSVERTSLRDMSCQVPSDEETYEDVTIQQRNTSRSSPVYASPQSSPKPCHPPLADTLLAPYHSHRKNSQSSYANTHSRSRSVPSSTSLTASSTESRPPHVLPSFTPLPLTSDSNLVPSTNTLLRSIKTSIYAMRKRLKDIRRLSEWIETQSLPTLDNVALSLCTSFY
ncbi:unnamed protein product [Adineta ricciae]|uniref:Uncharacterized protein n=1 Tax=Adineta ricciae TaxID=249248 RepID=A0A814KK62_ADIRI|nr:unnamed protein product [Adineta ricciae]